MLYPPSPYPSPLNPTDEMDAVTINQIQEGFGEFFTGYLAQDGQWARGILMGDQES